MSIDLTRAHAMALYNALGLDLSDEEFEDIYAAFLMTSLGANAFARIVKTGVELEKARQQRYQREGWKS